MSDETRRILDLLAAGRITADEAEQLLHAAAGEAAPAGDRGPAGTPGADARFLRIEVQETGGDQRPHQKVNLRVPLSFVRGGMRLGALIPGVGEGIQEALKEHGVEWSKLDRAELAAMLEELGELMIDVDDGLAQVKITVE